MTTAISWEQLWEATCLWVGGEIELGELKLMFLCNIQVGMCSTPLADSETQASVSELEC